MTRRISMMAAMVLAGSFAVGQTLPVSKEPTLKVGDLAPAFKVEGFAQGEELKGFERGQVYVIEFWATWCVPCVAAMPHLSKLSEEYKGKVTFVGVDGMEGVGEAGEGGQMGKVKRFLEKNPGKMTYRVAVDTAERDMVKGWFSASGNMKIPCTFVVDKEGKIAWIGHPMDVEEVLKQVVAGTLDAKAYAAAEAEKVPADVKAVTEIKKALLVKNYAEVLRQVEAYEKAFPEVAGRVGPQKFIAILHTDEARVVAMFDEAREAKQGTHIMGWAQMVSGVKNLKPETYEAVRRALEETGAGVMVNSTLSRMYVSAGDKEKAVSYAEKAVAEAKAGNVPAEQLERYEKALAVLKAAKKE